MDSSVHVELVCCLLVKPAMNACQLGQLFCLFGSLVCDRMLALACAVLCCVCTCMNYLCTVSAASVMLSQYVISTLLHRFSSLLKKNSMLCTCAFHHFDFIKFVTFDLHCR